MKITGRDNDRNDDIYVYIQDTEDKRYKLFQPALQLGTRGRG